MIKWNYKRGKAVNGTDLPNHVFLNINEPINGVGTSANPFNNWTDALNSVPYQGTIVVSPSLSLNAIDNYNANKIVYILGDSMNRDVQIKTTVQPPPRLNSYPNEFYMENVYIDGYAESGYANNIRKNCVIYSNITRCYKTGSYADFNNIYLNSTVNCKVDAYATSNPHTFYGCVMALEHNNNMTFRKLYIDSSCTLALKTSSITTVNFDDCYFEDLPAFIASAPAGLQVNILSQNINDPLLNAPSLIDFSVQNLGSSLLRTGSDSVGGKAFKGISYNTGQVSVQGLVNSNPKLEIFNGNIRFKSTVPVGTVTEIGGNGEITFTASTILLLSKPFTIGLGYNPEIEFYIRWKFSINDPYGAWKPFRFGEEATQNGNGVTNAEANYVWSDSNRIPYALAQGKIVLTKK